jgi:hypothetical protein
LPFYYGLTEGAWKHWARVWEIDYDSLVSRFASKDLMEASGTPLTRWFDATLLPRDDVAQKDNVRAMLVFGHASNSITRIPESLKGMQKLDLVHAIIAMLFIAAMLGHVYIGTLDMEGAFEAMGTGTVDLNWAKEHHSLWLEEDRAGPATNSVHCQAGPGLARPDQSR